MSAGLRARLLAAFVAATLLVLGTVNGVALPALERLALRQREEVLADQARVVSGVSAHYIRKGHDFLENIAMEYSQQIRARVLFLDADGRVLRDSYFKRQMLGQDLSARPEVRDALAGLTTVRLEPVPGAGRTLYAAAPVTEGGVAGAVLLAEDVEDLFALLARVRRLLLLASLGALAVAVAAGWIMATSLARPVTRLTAAVQEVAAGRLGARVPVAGRDELARLGAAFNAMAEQLDQLETSRRRFIADAAHELRTPLAGLRALVEPLLSGAITAPAQQADFLREIGSEVERLSALAEDLLTLSEMEADRPLNLGPVEAGALLARVADRLGPLARSRGVHLSIRCAPAMTLRVDGLKLERALDNLLHNAIEHAPEGSLVKVDAQRTPGGLRLAVQDQGPGIPPADLPHLFDRFYRADQARARRPRGGAGLGLAIVREIIQRHGGRVSAESTPGAGATFIVELPPATFTDP